MSIDKIVKNNCNLYSSSFRIILHKMNGEWQNSQAYPPSHTVKQMNFTCNMITSFGLELFCQYRWDNLLILRMQSNRITSIGCKYLTKAYMPNLQRLILRQNMIEEGGVLHLSKAQWPKLNCINIQFQQHEESYSKGFFWMTKMSLPSIRSLSMSQSQMCLHLELYLVLLENLYIQKVFFSCHSSRYCQQKNKMDFSEQRAIFKFLKARMKEKYEDVKIY